MKTYWPPKSVCVVIAMNDFIACTNTAKYGVVDRDGSMEKGEEETRWIDRMPQGHNGHGDGYRTSVSETF